MFIKNTPNIYNNEGINTINANSKGNKTVQQNDINWSNLILGKEARHHININTIVLLFIPNITPEYTPSNTLLSKEKLSIKFTKSKVKIISRYSNKVIKI